MNSNRHTDLSLRQHSQQRYLNTLRIGLIFLLGLSSIYLLDKKPELVSLENAFLSLAIVWISSYASFQYLADQNRPPMPFFPLVGIFYATSFGLPIFAGNVEFMTFFSLKSVDSTALMLVLLSLTSMNVFFYYSKSFLWNRVLPLNLPSTYTLKRLLAVLWVFLVLHLLSLYVPFIQEIPSLSNLLEPIGYISYGMFFILWKRNKISNFQKIIVCLCMTMEVIPKLASGSLAQMMLLGLFMTIVSFFETKRLPILLISLTVFFLVILNPIKGEFRQLTWSRNQTETLSPLAKIQIFSDLAINRYTSQKSSLSKNDIDLKESTVGRTAHIMLFSQVVKDTPPKVPYWSGQSYLPLFTSFIPRFVFPDKPEERTGNAFGRRYGYLSQRDFTTSLNLPWIVELYANFGDIGVILGMGLIGIFLGFLEQKFNRREMEPLAFITGATILLNLIYQESNFSLMVGNIFSLSLALFIIFKFFLGGKPKYSR